LFGGTCIVLLFNDNFFIFFQFLFQFFIFFENTSILLLNTACKICLSFAISRRLWTLLIGSVWFTNIQVVIRCLSSHYSAWEVLHIFAINIIGWLFNPYVKVFHVNSFIVACYFFLFIWFWHKKFILLIARLLFLEKYIKLRNNKYFNHNWYLNHYNLSIFIKIKLQRMSLLFEWSYFSSLIPFFRNLNLIYAIDSSSPYFS
jgi:hypothetical protein